jgi:tRNA(fMet)-specific endonuclease VapC
MIILDTDLVTLVLRRSSADSERLLSRIDVARKQQPVVTSIITYEEQVKGWFKLLSHAQDMHDEIEAYRRLRVHLDDYRLLTLVDFDEPAAVQFQRLRKSKIRIGTMDLKIAAIALARDAMVWTRNLRDFNKVPGLRVEDPIA